ncbi:MAG: hypothetical protein ACRD1L_00300 [Terriglobales bacterium]
MTQFDPGFTAQDYDLSPDGRELVLERVEERSEAVMLNLARP